MRSERILIVEDDADIREILAYIMGSLGGYRVTTTDSAFGVPGLVRELHPAVVLLDIGLPYRPGTELLDELKADPRTADVPVVIFSGLLEMLSEERRAMAAAVVRKPIDPARMLDVVHEILTGIP